MSQLMFFWDVMQNSLINGHQQYGETTAEISKYDKDDVWVYVQDVGKVTDSSMQGEQETEMMSQKNCESQYSKSILAGQSWVQTLVRTRSLCQNKAARVWH